jgi:endoglucanase
MYTGVNYAGAEFGGGNLPGTINQDYRYPSDSGTDYFLNKGLKTFRLPFKMERIVTRDGDNVAFRNTADITNIDAFVNKVTAAGGTVILDPHNYARFNGAKIGEAGFPIEFFKNFWVLLANRYKSNPRVIFGIMNEPHGVGSPFWRSVCDVVVPAIRATGATNLILVPGDDWSGAHSWVSGGNAAAFEGFQDFNFAFEVHQYLDSDPLRLSVPPLVPNG